MSTIEETTSSLQYKKASDIISRMTDDILTGTSEINDFTEGSITLTLIEAISTELEQLYYLAIENAETAIDTSVLSTFGFTRKTASYAYGTLRITFTNSLQNTFYIPKGTSFYSTISGYDQEYTTLDEYYVEAGQTTAYIVVYCTDTGVIGNVPSATINATTDMSYVADITNPSAFNTGSDLESLTDLQNRFRLMIQGLARGTVESLEYATLSVDNISGVYVWEDTYGTIIIYCHDANGDLSTTLQKTVADTLDSWRVAGTQLIVYPTHKTTTTLSIGVKVSDTSLETDSFSSLVKQTVENYINSLAVGDPIYIQNIVQKVMDISDLGIVDCSISLSVNPDISLEDEDYISDDAIININGRRVSHSYLQPSDISTQYPYGSVNYSTDQSDSAGTTWNNATTSTDGTSSYLEPITITDKYKTAPNEILRSGDTTVYFIDDSDYISVDTNSTTASGNALNLDI